MARLGKKSIPIPDKVKVAVLDDVVTVTGERGSLSRTILPGLSISAETGTALVKNDIPEQAKLYRKTDAYHGLMRTLLLNMVRGVSMGFEKVLEIHGVGYKADLKGTTLTMSIGFTHPVVFTVPDGVQVEVLKNTILFIRGIDKEKVGSFAAKVRSVFPPESYKGTGIRYRGEYVRQKVGKAAVGATK